MYCKKINLIICLILVFSLLLSACQKSEKVQNFNDNQAEAPQGNNPEQVDEVTYDLEYTADIIVVGAGGAGLTAGITAKENGSSVIILEKFNFTGGALNTTTGTISGARTKIQEEDGLTEDSFEMYIEDIFKEGKFKGDEALIRIYAENAGSTVDWLVENGLEINRDPVTGKRAIIAPEHTPYSYPRTYRPIAPEGYKSGVHAVLDGLVDKLNINVHLQTEAISLISNESGEVIGVLAIDGNGKRVKYNAIKGVVMATGGYAANPKLMGAYNDHAKNYITGGLPSANGYGIYMMQQVGAIIHEDAMSWVPSYPMGLEIRPGQGIIMYTKTQFFGGILVNIEGNRFVNEVGGNVEREEALAEQPKGTQWEIYNQEIVDRMMQDDVHRFYNAMLGMIMRSYPEQIITANSIEELASKIGVPANNLVRTVNNYNDYIENGIDLEFGRSFIAEFGNPRSFAQHVNKLENGPFFAVKIKPIALFTMGGVRVNDKFQVLDTSNQPIPGLYAAGETAGGVWGEFPSGGTGVMGSVTMGRLAGYNASTLDKPIVDTSIAKINQRPIDKNLFEVASTNIDSSDSSTVYKDGVYTGKAKGYIGDIEVKVTVKDGKIYTVEILSQQETESIAKGTLESTPKKIVDANSVGVDNVSGATATTDGIKNAVKNALENAK